MNGLEDPYDIILEMDNAVRENSSELPEQRVLRRLWSGIVFKIVGQLVVVPIDEVVEILIYPNMTNVPGLKNWMKGLANIRGNLLPVMDLKGFLTGKVIELNKKSRVLSFNHAETSVGFVVEEVHGLRYFSVEKETEQAPQLDDSLNPYLLTGYMDDEERHWGVFSLKKVVETKGFLQTAA